MKLVRCGAATRGSVCSVLADCLVCQAENTLQTLGDFVVHELESTLRAEVFQIMASRRQTKSSGAFLSKSVSATPAQVIHCLQIFRPHKRSLAACSLFNFAEVHVELGQRPYPTLSSVVKDDCAANPFAWPCWCSRRDRQERRLSLQSILSILLLACKCMCLPAVVGCADVPGWLGVGRNTVPL